jgi:hypothetical protein
MSAEKKAQRSKKKSIHLGRVTEELKRVKEQLKAEKRTLEDAEKRAIDLKIEGITRIHALLEDFCEEHQGKLGGSLTRFGFRPPFSGRLRVK